MDISTLTTLIGSLGFPIVVCFATFWFINNTMKDLQASLNKMTEVMTELVTHLKGDK